MTATSETTVAGEVIAEDGTSVAAESLESLAPRCRREEQVRDLAGALRGVGNASSAADWARVDLFSAFLSEDPTVPERERFPWWWALADHILQVGVFVPIFITWLGLALAAYSAQPGQSMLQSWESGSILSLHRVALITAGVVAILIAISLMQLRRRSAAEAKETRLRHELSEALTLAGLELAPLRQGVTDRVAQEMGEVAQSLANTATRLEGEVAQSLANTATRLEGAGRTASRLQQSATEAIEKVREALQSSRDAAAEFGLAPGKLIDPLARLTNVTSDIATATTASTEAVARALAEPLAALTEASSKIATATAAATTEISAVTTASSAGIAAAASASSAGIAASLDNQAAQIRAIVDEAIAAAGGYASRTEVATDAIGRTLADMPASVRDLQESIAAVDQKFSDLATALLAAQAEATQVLQATPGKLTESLTALTSATITVAEAERSLAATSQETTRQVTSLTTTATEISGSASRSADAIADILGKTQQTLADVPGTMRTLHAGVTGLSSQFADLAGAIADARAASGQLRQAITELRTTPQPPEAPQSQPGTWQTQTGRQPSPWQPTARQQVDYRPQPEVPQPMAPQPQAPQPLTEPEQKLSRWHFGR
jgi:hypothetical protein